MYKQPTQVTSQLLKISQLPKFGPVALRNICKVLDTVGTNVISNDENTIQFLSQRGKKTYRFDIKAFESTLNECEQHDISLYSCFDAEYPKILKELPDYPTLLFVKGNVSALSMPSCSVVGTRKASELGLDCARQISELLVLKGYCVVSGLALGIDAAAHEGALRGNGPTIAVLAHGLEQILPKENLNLGTDIIENGGVLVSTYPPKSKVFKNQFVERNRIQSGLSICSIIVESDELGGSMHHARSTYNYGRKLYCVLPNKKSKGFKNFNTNGAYKLIEENDAIPISSAIELESMIKSGKFTN